MKIFQVSTGFIDVPGKTSLNIYAQGCKIHCKGCHSKKLWPFDGGKNFTLSEILYEIKKRLPIGLTWVCWLGGDATFQPKELFSFSKGIKKAYPNLKICLYSGKYFLDLQNDPKISQTFEFLDAIVSGPWNGIPVSDPKSNQEIRIKSNETWKQISWNDFQQL